MKLFLTLLISFFVQSQQAFEELPAKIDDALRRGEPEISVHFAPGTYFYGEDFCALRDVEAPDTRLVFSGQDAVLVGRTGDDGTFSHDDGYVDLETLTPLKTKTEMRKAYFWPLKVPFRKDLYILRCKETPIDGEHASRYRLMMTQWYVGAEYPIEKVTRRHVYFRRDKWYTGILTELRFGRCVPRYQLCLPLEERKEKGYTCRSTRFLTLERASIRSLRMQGLRFLGNGDGDAGWLISLRDVQADSLSVESSVFEGLRSGGIEVARANGFLIENCTFSQCYRHCLYIATDVSGAVIRANRFYDNGLKISNEPIVDCKGSDFLISNNYFENFSYSAIGLGLHFTSPITEGTTGIVENNEICMTESFREGVPKMLIDSGAIYVWTINNGLIIRNNYIHDIAGPHGNRGILCDDGTVNVQIYGNRILRISNGYTIDLRKARRVERNPLSHIRKVNVGNVMRDNIVDGKIRFEVRRGDKTSLKGKNIILSSR